MLLPLDAPTFIGAPTLTAQQVSLLIGLHIVTNQAATIPGNYCRFQVTDICDLQVIEDKPSEVERVILSTGYTTSDY